MLKIILLSANIVFITGATAYLRTLDKNRNKLHRQYLISLVGSLFIILSAAMIIQTLYPTVDFHDILLKGSALVVAVVGFAAQPVIINVICGLLISIHKPFEIGDRIIVDGEKAGAVEDITLRHTVLRLSDNVRILIPNSAINSKTVTNLSYGMRDRQGVYLYYSVGTETDVALAMEIIRDCVASCPYTMDVETNGFREDSSRVYLTEIGDSKLVLRTIIWVPKGKSTTLASSDVNLRVLQAFHKYHITIPHPYVNVMQGEYTPPATPNVDTPFDNAPRRYHKTEELRIAPEESGLEPAIETAKRFASQQNLTSRACSQLELLTEESVELLRQFSQHAWRTFWIEGSNDAYRIHLRTFIKVNSLEEYQSLLSLSSSGQNSIQHSVNMRIITAILFGRDKLMNKRKGQETSVEWQLSEEKLKQDEISKSILGRFADDVRVSIAKEWVELTVLKNTSEQ